MKTRRILEWLNIILIFFFFFILRRDKIFFIDNLNKMLINIRKEYSYHHLVSLPYLMWNRIGLVSMTLLLLYRRNSWFSEVPSGFIIMLWLRLWWAGEREEIWITITSIGRIRVCQVEGISEWSLPPKTDSSTRTWLFCFRKNLQAQ